MTVEPKFIPNQAVEMLMDENFKVNVRLVDCVGYVIEGAKGYQDDQGIRYVKTPWYLESIPFDQAAKVGTKKVIQDHSTIGIVITSDGSICDIPGANYNEATDSIVEELLDIDKPFIIIINTKDVNLSLIHISEPTRQAEISYAVFCLKKKKTKTTRKKKHI